MTTGSRYEFGGFRLDPARRRLETAEGEPLTVSAKAFDTLLHLVRHAGELVPRRVLLDAVWPDTVVDENNLTQAVTSLRRVLGPESIVTVPGRGYQLVEPVRVVEAAAHGAPSPIGGTAGSRRARPGAMTSAAIGVLLALAAGIGGWLYVGSEETEPSIAVLPFEDPAAEPDEAYFAAELAADVMTLLGDVRDLRVLYRESSFALQDSDRSPEQIAALLGVDYVLDAAIARDGDRLTLEVALRDAEGGPVLERSFDSARSAAVDLQQDIARAVVGALRAQMGEGPDSRPRASEPIARPAGSTDDPEAYALYRLAENARWNADGPEDYHVAVDYYGRALALDPDYGLAQVGLARVLDTLRILTPPPLFADVDAQRNAAVRKAVEFAPEVPAALGILAREQLRDRKWSEAHRTLEERVERTPDSDYESYLGQGTFLSLVGHLRDSVKALRKAEALNPLSAQPSTHLAIVYDALGDTERAFEIDRRMQKCCAGTYDVLAMSAQFWRVLAEGDTRLAQRMLADLRGVPLDEFLSSGIPEDHASQQDAFNRMINRSIELLHDEQQALEELRKTAERPDMANPIGRGNIALLAAYFGDEQLALDTLRRIRRDQPEWVLRFAWTPLMREVRRHEDFKALVRGLGLVDYWREHGWPDHCWEIDDDDFECG